MMVLRQDSQVDLGDDAEWVPLTMDANGSLRVSSGAASATANGTTPFKTLDLDETEEAVKATAGNVYGIAFTNRATATRYLKFYNATVANVTVGTTVPDITMGLPGAASDDDVSGWIAFPAPITFSTAITVAATTGFADNDAGAPAANDVLLTVFFA
jgi:hypothetical protein